MDTGLSTHAYCVEVYIREEWAAFDCKKQHKAGDNLDGFGGTSIGGRYTTNGFLTGTVLLKDMPCLTLVLTSLPIFSRNAVATVFVSY